jgi:hypothetical protein
MILVIHLNRRGISVEMQTANKKFTFDWQVSLGNILTILIFIISGFVYYTRLEDQVSAIIREFAEHKNVQNYEMTQVVRKDVQDTRNRFIDQQLNDINDKLDKLLQRNR